jgi:hypothetical protein
MTLGDFAKIYRGCATDDLSKPRSWHFCVPRLYRPSVYRRSDLKHGPTTFKLLLPIVVRVHASRSWGVQWRGSYNVWIYTRWNFACCIGVRSCFVLRETHVD